MKRIENAVKMGQFMKDVFPDRIITRVINQIRKGEVISCGNMHFDSIIKEEVLPEFDKTDPCQETLLVWREYFQNIIKKAGK